MTETETTGSTPHPTEDSADKAMAAERAHAQRVRDIAAQSTQPAPVSEPDLVKHSGPVFWPLLAGGVVAALIGAGATVWALPKVPQLAALLPQPTQDALGPEIDSQNQKIATLEAKVATLGAQPATAPEPDLSGLRATLDENAAALRTLDTRLKAVEDKVAISGSTPAAAVDTSALQGELDALKAQVSALTPTAIAQQVNSAAADAEARLKQSEAQSADLRAQAEAAVQRTIKQASLARLAAAFDAGAPLGPAIADATSAGLTIPAGISATVPTLASLQMAFPEASRAALAASRKQDAKAGGIGDRVVAFMMTQVGARSVEPRDGADPDAVLSRAAAAVEAGDIARAVSEIDALPDAGKQAISGWVALAQERLAASTALTDLAASVR